MAHDRLLIKGGHVIDPANNVDTKANVLLEKGQVAYVGPDHKPCERTIDASGLLVTPGADRYARAISVSRGPRGRRNHRQRHRSGGCGRVHVGGLHGKYASTDRQ